MTTGVRAHPHPRVPRWFADLVAVVLVASSAVVPFPEAEFRPNSGAEVAVVIAPVLLLPFRRRWPIAVLAGCLALYGIAASMGTLAPGIVLAASIAMFNVANQMRRRASFIVGLCAIVAVVGLSLLAAIENVFDPRAFQFAVTLALASAMGDAYRSNREFIKATTERAERAEQTRESEARRRVTEERLRIARDLHDVVAHQISVISLKAGVASSALESRPEKAREALSAIRGAARTVLGEIGDLLRFLRTEDEQSAESAAAPQPGLERLDELVRRFADAGLAVTVRTEGDLSGVPETIDLVAYRVIQEGLTNAHKHGAEHRAHVLIEVGDQNVTVAVTNPVTVGIGGNHPAAPQGGYGLLGLRERVASVRGVVQTGLVPGGYRLVADLPLLKEESP